MTASTQSAEASRLSMIRVDAAHRVKSAPPSEEDLPESADLSECMESIDAAEQIRIHAGQLARHLQDRRREVDHRETQLNARLAQLENDTRNSRLLLHERTDEFTRREADLTQQLADLEAGRR